MLKDLVPLVVALVAAFATVIVSLVNGRNTSRDDRGNLLRDIEIAKQLKDGSPAKAMQEEFITRQIRSIIIRFDTKATRLLVLLFSVFGQTIAVIFIARRIIANNSTEYIDRIIYGFLAITMVAMIHQLFLHQAASVNARDRLNEIAGATPVKPSKPGRIRAFPRISRFTEAFRAGLAVLTQADPHPGDLDEDEAGQEPLPRANPQS